MDAHEAIELGTVREGRECSSEMGLGVAVEVPFAGEPRPAGEDGEGDYLALAEGGWWSGASLFGGLRLAKIVDDDVKCREEGVHVDHEESVPFPVGSGSKPTLERGHLPLKSSPDNSHQAFKAKLFDLHGWEFVDGEIPSEEEATRELNSLQAERATYLDPNYRYNSYYSGTEYMEFEELGIELDKYMDCLDYHAAMKLASEADLRADDHQAKLDRLLQV